MDKGLGHLFLISTSFHFLNKTDFELYLFKADKISGLIRA